MSNVDIIRAWKDAEYRDSLSREQLAALPQHPSLVLSFGAGTNEGTVAWRTNCSPCTAAPTGYASAGTNEGTVAWRTNCSPCTAAPTGYASEGIVALRTGCTPCSVAPTGYA